MPMLFKQNKIQEKTSLNVCMSSFPQMKSRPECNFTELTAHIKLSNFLCN